MVQGYESTKVEVHIIAYVYHWGRNEIMHLPIKERQHHCDMIKKQKEAENSETS